MTTEQKLIKNKLGLLQLASYLQNVSEACRVMGYSRDTFYRVKIPPVDKNGTVIRFGSVGFSFPRPVCVVCGFETRFTDLSVAAQGS